MAGGVKPTPRQVRARVTHWAKVLGLSTWKIEVTFDRDEDDGSEAFCVAAPEYRHVRVNFDVSKWKPSESLDHMVCHELLHAVVWPLASWAEAMTGGDPVKLEACRREEEGLVTALQHIITRLV